MSIVPASRPQLSREEALKLIHERFPGYKGGVVVLGVRGYYRDTMGKPGKNDRGIYDDALFVISDHVFAAFNGNTDPRVYAKRIANLAVGVWRYKPGIHGLSKPAAQRYKAFVQAAPVTVIRDQVGPDTGWFGINIHRGGNTTTSSAGCQTIPPSQWEAFRSLLMTELDRAKQTEFRYVLIDGPVR